MSCIMWFIVFCAVNKVELYVGYMLPIVGCLYSFVKPELFVYYYYFLYYWKFNTNQHRSAKHVNDLRVYRFCNKIKIKIK